MLQNLPIILFHNAPNLFDYAPDESQLCSNYTPDESVIPKKIHSSCNKDIGTE